jgi:hypothetical protein
MFYFYPLTYLWRSTPVVLVGLLSGTWILAARRRPLHTPIARQAVLGLLLLVIFFTLSMTFGSKKFDRYLLPVFAPLDLFAGLGWVGLAYWLQEKLKPAVSRIVIPAVLILLVGFQVYGTLRTFPYYLTYYNPLLGGIQKAQQVMQIGWGEGLDQAGRYLGQKENARDLQVMSWYPIGAFSYFFPGTTELMYIEENFTEKDWQRLEESDYVVVYVHQWQRQIPKNLLDFLAERQPEHSIWIDGLEYARIYSTTEP